MSGRRLRPRIREVDPKIHGAMAAGTQGRRSRALLAAVCVMGLLSLVVLLTTDPSVELSPPENGGSSFDDSFIVLRDASSRLQVWRSDGGRFWEHPLSADYWFESADVANSAGYTEDTALAWKVLTRSKKAEGSGLDVVSLVLQDASLPSRNVFMRLEFRVQGTPGGRAGRLVEAGTFSISGDRNGPWSEELALQCDEKWGCSAAGGGDGVERMGRGRVIWKKSGGALREAAQGAVWAEYESYSQQLQRPSALYATAVETETRVLALDAKNGVWLRIDNAEEALRVLARAEDLARCPIWKAPAGAVVWKQVTVPCDPYSSCLEGKDGAAMAVARKKHAQQAALQKRQAQRTGPALHLIFSVEPKPKYDWQVRFFKYWYDKSQNSANGGSVTRLLTSDGPDDLMEVIPTYIADVPEEYFARDMYLPYNKITSILQWIKEKHSVLPEDAIVVIMDVDVVLVKDLSYIGAQVRKGRPVGAKGFMWFSGRKDNPNDKMIQHYCKGCTTADPLAVPIFIHKDDLLELAPRWLKKCKEIRDDTTPWSDVKDWRTHKPLQLSWTAEQWAYLLAAAEMGLRHTVRTDISAFTGMRAPVLREPMIHFSDWTRGKDYDGKEYKWSKVLPNPLEKIPLVDEKRNSALDATMLTELKDARAHVFPELDRKVREREARLHKVGVEE